MQFERDIMAFTSFMSSTSGRTLRVVVGAALIVTGIVAGGGWYALALVGVVPLIAGLVNVCLFAPLFSQPFKATTQHRP